jgi:hypothetical protein
MEFIVSQIIVVKFSPGGSTAELGIIIRRVHAGTETAAKTKFYLATYQIEALRKLDVHCLEVEKIEQVL